MKIYSRQLVEYALYFFIGLILIKLGLWQMHRAVEKKSLVTQHALATNGPIRDWTLNASMPKPFEKIRLVGKPLLPMIYLDNQFYQHQLGYDVLLPVLQKDGHVALIDYGWKKAPDKRGQWPRTMLTATSSWLGQAYYPKNAAFRLGDPLESQTMNWVVLESLDVKILASLLKRPVYPWIIRLQGDDTDFKRSWPIVSVMPERHGAYALQWFVMAALVFLIFIWRVLKK